MAVVNKGASGELKARFGIPPEDTNPELDMAAGASAGTLVGAGAALTCGPFMFLCALATVPLGFAVGAVGGAVVGTAVDAGTAPPEEHLLVLDNLFVKISQQRKIHIDIRNALEQKIPTDRLVDPSAADAVLQLVLGDVRFTRSGSPKYILTLKSYMLPWQKRTSGPVRYGKRDYVCTSRALFLSEWVQDEGRLLNQAIDICVESLAEDMVADVRFTN